MPDRAAFYTANLKFAGDAIDTPRHRSSSAHPGEP